MKEKLLNMTRSITQAYRFEKHKFFESNKQSWKPRFDPELAREIGFNESMLFLQLEYLIVTSRNERDGRLWTFQTVRDLAAMLACGKSTVQRAIKSLEKQNLIFVTGKYNRKKYDRTNWFAINFEGVARLESFQDGTRSIQDGTRSIQNGTSLSHGGTTIPNRSTERSTKRSSKNNFENEHDFSNDTTNVLATDLDRSGETVPPCENSAATNADSIIDGEYVDDSAALIVAGQQCGGGTKTDRPDF